MRKAWRQPSALLVAENWIKKIGSEEKAERLEGSKAKGLE
jgi:hypothetical protein